MFWITTACLLLSQPAARGPESGVPIGKGTEKPQIVLSGPRGGWTVSRMVEISGTVSDPTIDPIVLSINGDRYLLRTFRGRFARAFPSASGKNVITARATNRGGTTQAQATFYANLPAVPLKLVLTSDTDGVYTDLHVYEPTPEAKQGSGLDFAKLAHVYWADTNSPSGGTFFLNEQGGSFDQPGYGPYLYIHRAPPLGLFIITTNYWPSGDKAHTRATLNLSLFEGTPSEIRRLVQIPLATPGTTRTLALVNVLGENQAEVYVPGQDRPPSGERWPTNLDALIEAAEGRAAAEGE